MRQENYGGGGMTLMSVEFLKSRLHAFLDLEKIPFNSIDRGKLCTVSGVIEREIYSALVNGENITTRLLIIESLCCDQNRCKTWPTLMEVSVHV